MAKKPNATGRRKLVDADDPNADAFSIATFCKRNGICVASFYKFKAEMPKTFSIGARRLISREAAARWRAEREAAST